MVACMTDKRTVPTTPLLRRYQRLAKGREKDRWAEARLFEQDPADYLETFASEFEQSVETFATYDNADEGFYGKRKEPDRIAAEDHSNTYDLVKELMQPGFVVTPNEDGNRTLVSSELLADVPATDLRFRSIDRELVVHRTTHSTWDDGRQARGGVRIDLLMASGTPQLPAVGELKIGDDKDPFFALLQALTGAAHLATEPQYRRVVQTYGEAERLTPPTVPPQLDAYVLHFRPVEADNDERHLCKRAAEAFREQVLTYEPVSRSVRRLAVLELAFDQEGKVSAAVRFACQVRTQH